MGPISYFELLRTGGRRTSVRQLSRIARVSVVVPCYNYGRFLNQCVRSVLDDQPGVEVEVIIVDDKSTDESVDIALALAAKDGRIRVIQHEQNKGHIATYNDGLDAATGEFVLLLSADDLVTPGALTRAAEVMVADTSVGIVYGKIVEFHDELPPASYGGRTCLIWPGVRWLRARCRSGYNVVASPEVMMRTSLLRHFGGYKAELPHAGDFEMWLRSSAVSNVAFLLGVDQAFRRRHSSNMSRASFNAGTAAGQLIDLKQRWQSFEAVFSGEGRHLPGMNDLRRTARQTLAREALQLANYAYARGFRDFPIESFEALAYEIFPAARTTRAGRSLARRKAFGMVSLPLNPLWATSAVAWRLEGKLQDWRRSRLGI